MGLYRIYTKATPSPNDQGKGQGREESCAITSQERRQSMRGNSIDDLTIDTTASRVTEILLEVLGAES